MPCRLASICVITVLCRLSTHHKQQRVALKHAMFLWSVHPACLYGVRIVCSSSIVPIGVRLVDNGFMGICIAGSGLRQDVHAFATQRAAAAYAAVADWAGLQSLPKGSGAVSTWLACCNLHTVHSSMCPSKGLCASPVRRWWLRVGLVTHSQLQQGLRH